MPIKWTPEVDQLLLLKILETHELKVDAKKISGAWPTDRGEAPTARAITERLVKIRKDAIRSGAGHFGISSSQSKSATNTPSKPRNTPAKNLATPNKSANTTGVVKADRDNGSPTPGVPQQSNGSPTKRKHDDQIKTEPQEGNIVDLSSRSPPNANANAAKPASNAFHTTMTNGHSIAESVRGPLVTSGNLKKPIGSVSVQQNGVEAEEVGSPKKRARRASTRPTSYGSDGDVGCDSDASAYEEEEEIAV